MDYEELLGWANYLAHEPINSVEMQLAQLTQVVSASFGGKITFDEALFTQYKAPKNEEKEMVPMSASNIRSKFSNLI